MQLTSTLKQIKNSKRAAIHSNLTRLIRTWSIVSSTTQWPKRKRMERKSCFQCCASGQMHSRLREWTQLESESWSQRTRLKSKNSSSKASLSSAKSTSSSPAPVSKKSLKTIGRDRKRSTKTSHYLAKETSQSSQPAWLWISWRSNYKSVRTTHADVSNECAKFAAKSRNRSRIHGVASKTSRKSKMKSVLSLQRSLTDLTLSSLKLTMKTTLAKLNQNSNNLRTKTQSNKLI